MNTQKTSRSPILKRRRILRKQRRILIKGSASSGNARQMPVALQLVVGLLVLISIGTALLMLPGASTRSLSFMEAFFTSTSASAVTGLSLLPDKHRFNHLGAVDPASAGPNRWGRA